MRADVKALPAPFLDRLRRIIPTARWDAAANTFTEPKPTTFRVNTLQATVSTVREQLHAQGFHLERVPWFPEAWILRRGTLRQLQETEAYHQGAIYVQSLSSMLPPIVLNPQPGETILDLTAAPGSKTTQMACLMRGEGRIIANDNHQVRFYKLRANVEQQGARNVELRLAYGESIGRHEPERYDRVLVDAPCSTEGRFLVSEPASYRYWKPGKIREMAHKQKRLLLSGLDALRPGGTLVYATCTFAPEENEAVVSWALERVGGAVRVEPMALELPNQQPGLAAWDQATFDPSLRRAARILPTKDMEGFFIACLRKHTT